MADRTALGMIGVMLGAATLLVTVVGVVVVGGYPGPQDPRTTSVALSTDAR